MGMSLDAYLWWGYALGTSEENEHIPGWLDEGELNGKVWEALDLPVEVPSWRAYAAMGREDPGHDNLLREVGAELADRDAQVTDRGIEEVSYGNPTYDVGAVGLAIPGTVVNAYYGAEHIPNERLVVPIEWSVRMAEFVTKLELSEAVDGLSMGRQIAPYYG